MNNTQHSLKIARSHIGYVVDTTWLLKSQPSKQQWQRIRATLRKNDAVIERERTIEGPGSSALKDMLQAVDGVDSVYEGGITGSGRHSVEFTLGKLFELTNERTQMVVAAILNYVEHFGGPVEVTDEVNGKHYYALLEFGTREVTEQPLRATSESPLKEWLREFMQWNPEPFVIVTTETTSTLRTADTLEEFISTADAPPDEARQSEEMASGS